MKLAVLTLACIWRRGVAMMSLVPSAALDADVMVSESFLPLVCAAWGMMLTLKGLTMGLRAEPEEQQEKGVQGVVACGGN